MQATTVAVSLTTGRNSQRGGGGVVIVCFTSYTGAFCSVIPSLRKKYTIILNRKKGGKRDLEMLNLARLSMFNLTGRLNEDKF